MHGRSSRSARVRLVGRVTAMGTATLTALALSGCALSLGSEPAAKQKAASTTAAQENATPAVAPKANATHAGATPAAAGAVRLASPLQALPASRNETPQGLTGTPGGGGYTKITIPGPVSGHSGSAYVWFPPSYNKPGHERTQYPVIEVFHGYKPAPLAFFSYYHLDEEMAKLVEKGKMREAVIVLPDWAPAGLDTECVDGGGGNVAMETWLTQDVPAYIAGTYRVARDRGSWAGYGASTGGWCALMASTLHPATFGSAVSVGGQGYPEFDPPYIPFTPESPSGQRYNLTKVLREQAPPVALWLLTAKTDKESYPTSSTMIAAAKAPTSLDAVVLDSGRHHPMFWLPYIPATLKWLGASTSGFAPQK